MKRWGAVVRAGVAGVVGAALACGCAGSGGYVTGDDASAVASRVALRADTRHEASRFVGPPVPLEGGGMYMLRMARLADGTMPVEFYVAVRYRGGQWRFYQRAHDAEGTSLPMVVIHREPDCGIFGCAFEEHLGVLLSLDYLERHRTQGFTIVVGSDSAEASFSVPGAYVEGFLAGSGVGASGLKPSVPDPALVPPAVSGANRP